MISVKLCKFPVSFRIMLDTVNTFSYQPVSSTYQLLCTPTSLFNILCLRIILLEAAGIGVFNPGYWSIDRLLLNSLATNSALLNLT